MDMTGNEDSDRGGLLAESLAVATRTFQQQFVRAAVAASGGNMSAAARRLGLGRNNLYRKLAQLGLPTRLEELRG
jgi:DNA-binding NtrC family response regulator